MAAHELGMVAVALSGQVLIMSCETGEIKATWQFPKATCLSWKPTDRNDLLELLAGGDSGRLEMLDVNVGRQHSLHSPNAIRRFHYAAEWNPVAQHVVAVAGANGAAIVTTEKEVESEVTNEISQQGIVSGEPIKAIAWAPSGNSIAVGEQGAVSIYTFTRGGMLEGRRRVVLTALRGDIRACQFVRDGAAIAAIADAPLTFNGRQGEEGEGEEPPLSDLLQGTFGKKRMTNGDDGRHGRVAVVDLGPSDEWQGAWELALDALPGTVDSVADVGHGVIAVASSVSGKVCFVRVCAGKHCERGMAGVVDIGHGQGWRVKGLAHQNSGDCLALVGNAVASFGGFASVVETRRYSLKVSRIGSHRYHSRHDGAESKKEQGGESFVSVVQRLAGAVERLEDRVAKLEARQGDS